MCCSDLECVSSIAIGGDDLKFLQQASIDYYKTLTGDTGFHKDTFIDTHAKGEAAVAMGVQAQATGDWSMTLGVKSETDAKSAVALGTGAKGKAEGVVALGAGSVAERAALKLKAGAKTTSSTAKVDDGNVYANDNASDAAKAAVSATVKQVAGAPLGAVSVGNANNTRQITHVAAGTEDSDAVNVAQLKAVAEATATTSLTVTDGKVNTPAAGNKNKLATAGDIADAINDSGFQATAGGNLASGSTATATTVKPGQKVTFAAGDGLTVKQKVDEKGNQTYTYALAQTPVVYTKADGDKVYKHSNGNFYDKPEGQAGAQEVQADAVIASMQNAAGSTTVPTTLANVKAGTKDNDAVNVGQLKGAADALGGGAGIADGSDPAVPAGTFIKPSYTITKTDGTNYDPANNVGTALSNLNKEVVKPITFAGDSGAASTRKLGETLTIKGGATGTLTEGNIGVESDGNGTLTAKLAQNIKLGANGSVKTGATQMDNNGITIDAPTPTNTVSLSSSGLNNGGNKISNVADGTAPNDAVNVSQLNQALGSISGANTVNFTALNNKVNEVAADAKAGTAAAMAVAGLPQAYLPGKSMMAVGGSVYRGESGYAIGYSTISDGGNWIIKGTATGNSRGHYGATAAVGYQW